MNQTQAMHKRSVDARAKEKKEKSNKTRSHFANEQRMGKEEERERERERREMQLPCTYQVYSLACVYVRAFECKRREKKRKSELYQGAIRWRREKKTKKAM